MDGAPRRATYAEYLEREAAAGLRHEYVDGVIRAKSGGSIEHGRLISRLTGLLAHAVDDIYVDGLGPIVSHVPAVG